ncbi:hypothetical protein BD414DRAFT_498685 [Trametes punicea]|nr:hypothetical protein BD414DRAFT_498685 [Trametes punicea]
MNMRLLGARTIDEIVPEMVDASSLSSHTALTPQDKMFSETCECMHTTGAGCRDSKILMSIPLDRLATGFGQVKL